MPQLCGGDDGGSSSRCFSSSTGGGVTAGMDLAPSCPEGDDGRMNMDAC